MVSVQGFGFGASYGFTGFSGGLRALGLWARSLWRPLGAPCYQGSLLKGSWDLVSKVISSL